MVELLAARLIGDVCGVDFNARSLLVSEERAAAAAAATVGMLGRGNSRQLQRMVVLRVDTTYLTSLRLDARISLYTTPLLAADARSKIYTPS